MTARGWQKVGVYLLGVALGILVLLAIQRFRGERPSREPHPWHAQTAPEGTYPLEITDDYGRAVTVPAQPRWIVSLAPSATEMLFAMGMGDHLSAVTDWDTYPGEARALRDRGMTVGSLDQPDIERIYTLPADLVLGSKLTPAHVYRRIQRPPRPIAVAIEPDSLDDLLQHDLPRLGRLLGVPGKALELVLALRERREAVADRLAAVQARPRRSAVLLTGIEETLAPGWSPGEGTWVDALLREVHGENLAASLGTQWGQFPLESLLAADPEVLFVIDGENPEDAARLRERVDRLPHHPVWQHLRAVRDGRVVILPAGPLNIPGPRMVDALEAMAEGLWPQAFAAS